MADRIGPGEFDIQAFVDGQQLRPIHFRVLVLCGLVMFIDGFDVFMLGKIAPAIAAGFGQDVVALREVFLFQQIGLLVGAFAMTPLGDVIGRQKVLVGCSIAFGLLTLACLSAGSLFQLAVYRGLSGIFLSGVLPMAISLVAEFTPKRRRSTFVSLTLAFYTVGAAAGGAVAAWLIDDHGWQSGFWIGGVVPLLLAPLLLFLLPESAQFLAGRAGQGVRIARILRAIQPDLVLTGAEDFRAGDALRSADERKGGILDIFRDGRARVTAVMWLACLFSMGNIALLAAWMPSFFQEMAGIRIQDFAIAAMIGFVGGFVGTITMGWLMDRVRPTRLIPLYYLANAVAVVTLAHVPFGTAAFVGVLLAWNFFQSGGQAGINTLVSQVYPASARSTGIGWAGGAGRIGGVILPQLGAIPLARHFTLETTLALIAIPSICVAILILFLGQTRAATDRLSPAAA